MEKTVRKRPPISNDTKLMLWLISAGRCQFKNCNKKQNIDTIKKSYKKYGYVAHIYGFAEGSERYDEILSPKLEKDISNLMLLCDECHRRIDEKGIGGTNFSALDLISMKQEHEERIERLTEIAPNMDSHVVVYKANIGEHSPVITYESSREYLMPHYPALNRSINLGLENSPQRDKDKVFWDTELNILVENYNQNLKPLLVKSMINHISLFSFAPMPLLIKLGTLFGDKISTEVKQYDRNTGSWDFSKKDIATKYKVLVAENASPTNVVLNISLSATINNDRITSVLGNKCTIYTFTIDSPNNGYLVSKKQLDDFTFSIRNLFNEIKEKYGANTPLHIFPTMPISTAVELGRYWMPKADMPLVIYDENKLNDGFFKAIEIN